jgi:putative copper export protein
MEAFLRMHLGATFWTIVVLVVLWLGLSWLARLAQDNGSEFGDPQIIKKVRNVLCIVIALGALVFLVDGILTNATPQAVIDRSGVNEQQKEHDRRAQETATPAPTPEKEERR